MTDKAYIVANEEQEREVLKKLYGQGYKWKQHQNGWLPQQDIFWIGDFPFCLFAKDNYLLKYGSIKDIRNHEIVYDGRKGSKMKISKEVYDALVEWQKDIKMNWAHTIVNTNQLEELPTVAYEWWESDDISDGENNNRLIAIIRWVNGEDVFEIEKPKKWVIRSKETDDDNEHLYVSLGKKINISNIETYFGLYNATRFDTKEEAESWANAHQEVIEAEI